MSLGPLKKGSTHLDAKSPLRIRAHGLLKNDITKAKDNDIISIGQQVNNSLQPVLSLEASYNASKARQIRQNILRTFWLFLRRKEKSNETLDSFQKCIQQLYFLP